jgi:hypothetical protein
MFNKAFTDVAVIAKARPFFHLDPPISVERSDSNVETFSTEIDVTSLGIY